MSTVRVLVVDDDRDLREAIIDLLGDEGYDVASAENGAEALEALRNTLPHIILLDLMMPVIDGYEFRARQLADPCTAHIPVIAMTASGSEDQRIHVLQAQAFMRKPFDFKLLLSLIELHATR